MTTPLGLYLSQTYEAQKQASASMAQRATAAGNAAYLEMRNKAVQDQAASFANTGSYVPQYTEDELTQFGYVHPLKAGAAPANQSFTEWAAKSAVSVPVGIYTGVAGMGQGMVQLAQMGADIVGAKGASEFLGYVAEGGAEELAKINEEYGEYAAYVGANAVGSLLAYYAGGTVVKGLAGAAGIAGATTTAGKVAQGVAAAGLYGAPSIGDLYGEARAAGASVPYAAFMATGTGFISGASEMVGMEQIGKVGKVLQKAISQPVAGSVWKTAAKQIIIAQVGEATQESFQTIVENAGRMTFKGGVNLTDGLAEAALGAAIAAPFGVGLGYAQTQEVYSKAMAKVEAETDKVANVLYERMKSPTFTMESAKTLAEQMQVAAMDFANQNMEMLRGEIKASFDSTNSELSKNQLDTFKLIDSTDNFAAASSMNPDGTYNGRAIAYTKSGIIDYQTNGDGVAYASAREATVAATNKLMEKVNSKLDPQVLSTEEGLAQTQQLVADMSAYVDQAYGNYKNIYNAITLDEIEFVARTMQEQGISEKNARSMWVNINAMPKEMISPDEALQITSEIRKALGVSVEFADSLTTPEGREMIGKFAEDTKNILVKKEGEMVNKNAVMHELAHAYFASLPRAYRSRIFDQLRETHGSLHATELEERLVNDIRAMLDGRQKKEGVVGKFLSFAERMADMITNNKLGQFYRDFALINAIKDPSAQNLATAERYMSAEQEGADFESLLKQAPQEVPEVRIETQEEAMPKELLESSPQIYQDLAMMEEAKPGKRMPTDEGWTGTPSTFPDWVPKNLKKTTLFKKVIQNITEGTVPRKNATRQWDLYNVVYKRALDAQFNQANTVIEEASNFEMLSDPAGSQQLRDTIEALNKSRKFMTSTEKSKVDNLIEKYNKLVDKAHKEGYLKDEPTKLSPADQVKLEQVPTTAQVEADLKTGIQAISLADQTEQLNQDVRAAAAAAMRVTEKGFVRSTARVELKKNKFTTNNAANVAHKMYKLAKSSTRTTENAKANKRILTITDKLMEKIREARVKLIEAKRENEVRKSINNLDLKIKNAETNKKSMLVEDLKAFKKVWEDSNKGKSLRKIKENIKPIIKLLKDYYAGGQLMDRYEGGDQVMVDAETSQAWAGLTEIENKKMEELTTQDVASVVDAVKSYMRNSHTSLKEKMEAQKAEFAKKGEATAEISNKPDAFTANTWQFQPGWAMTMNLDGSNLDVNNENSNSNMLYRLSTASIRGNDATMSFKFEMLRRLRMLVEPNAKKIDPQESMYLELKNPLTDEEEAFLTYLGYEMRQSGAPLKDIAGRFNFSPETMEVGRLNRVSATAFLEDMLYLKDNEYDLTNRKREVYEEYTNGIFNERQNRLFKAKTVPDIKVDAEAKYYNERSKVNDAFAKPEKGSDKEYRTDFVELMLESFDEDMHYVEMTPIMHEVAGVVNSPAYKAKVGEEALRFWKNRLDIIARKGQTAHKHPLARMIRKSLTTATLGFKPSSIAIQPFSIGNGLAMAMIIDPKAAKYIFRELPKLLAGISGKYVKTGVMNSAGLQNRIGEIKNLVTNEGKIIDTSKENEIVKLAKEGKYGEALAKLQDDLADVSLSMLGGTDMIAATVVQQGFFNYYKSEGLSDSEANSKADFLMSVSQASSDYTVMPSVLRESDFYKLAFMFNSFSMAQSALFYQGYLVRGTRYLLKGDLPEAFKSAMGGLIQMSTLMFGAFLIAIINDTIKGKEETYETIIPEAAGKTILSVEDWMFGFASQIPVIGQLTANFQYGKSWTPPITGRAYDAYSSLSKMYDKGVFADKGLALADALNSIQSLVIGLPAQPAVDILEGVSARQEKAADRFINSEAINFKGTPQEARAYSYQVARQAIEKAPEGEVKKDYTYANNFMEEYAKKNDPRFEDILKLRSNDERATYLSTNFTFDEAQSILESGLMMGIISSELVGKYNLLEMAKLEQK